MLKKLSNKKTLNAMILVSCSIFVFSLYKVKDINDLETAIEYANDELSLNQSELEHERRDLAEIQKKFANIPLSKIPPLKDNGHLILDDIKIAARQHGMTASFFLESEMGQGQGTVNFGDESGIDENTGAAFYSMRLVSTYENYTQLKKFIKNITADFPISITSISVNGKEMQVVMNVYSG